ncbi:MAG TPA: serine O-acetyltransferase [Burkholderiaceae bacterium]|nr:serine O-acetyltransferase [Burkholderiaceae bacterium]
MNCIRDSAMRELAEREQLHLAMRPVPPLPSLWEDICADAIEAANQEAGLQPFLHDQILQHRCFETAVAHVIAGKLAGGPLDVQQLRTWIRESMEDDFTISAAVQADIQAVRERDPACGGASEPLLYYKGLHALSAHRIAHRLWHRGRRRIARNLQSLVSERLGVDIHPAARIGQGILLDHGHGFVMGETAVIEDNVSILHNVTLGGTGKDTGNRHPKVRSGVLIGAGALILGNIEIGHGAKIGAGSVVMRSVPPHVTVAGKLAQVVGMPSTPQPSLEMNHQIGCELVPVARQL